MWTGRRPEGPFHWPSCPAPFRPLPLHLGGLPCPPARPGSFVLLLQAPAPASILKCCPLAQALSTQHFINCSIFQFPPGLLVGSLLH